MRRLFHMVYTVQATESGSNQSLYVSNIDYHLNQTQSQRKFEHHQSLPVRI